ncbi:E3 ubiquitin-protein ligase At4g11680-like [Ziziphus jujuba]|uniref:RING-type E3 ubiquitin transferase n=1 Tax=Ziziphus jujuba TaxID=326968 RepID=A0ABM4AB11_ZIZJJ|nr:E3 ubiquitin-protein ligase At4g11680-like [Ziziphus jujuba]
MGFRAPPSMADAKLRSFHFKHLQETSYELFQNRTMIILLVYGRSSSDESDSDWSVQSLRKAAELFFRQARSMMVSEMAAKQLEMRRSDWAYSKPIVILYVIWNFTFVVMVVTVMARQQPQRPNCYFNLENEGIESDSYKNLSTAAREDSEKLDEDDEKSSKVAKHLEYANTVFSLIWWFIGLYLIRSSNGQALEQKSPELYWVCIVFLGFDVFFVVLACVILIAVCCCLPCIIGFSSLVEDKVFEVDLLSRKVDRGLCDTTVSLTRFTPIGAGVL